MDRLTAYEAGRKQGAAFVANRDRARLERALADMIETSEVARYFAWGIIHSAANAITPNVGGRGVVKAADIVRHWLEHNCDLV